jgi:hypothetical protein
VTDGEVNDNLHVLPTNPETDTLHNYSNKLWRDVLDAARKAVIADKASASSVIAAAKTAAGSNSDALKIITTIESKTSGENIVISNAK